MIELKADFVKAGTYAKKKYNEYLKKWTDDGYELLHVLYVDNEVIHYWLKR